MTSKPKGRSTVDRIQPALPQPIPMSRPGEAAKHNHGANFGRHVDDCPRCIELAGGAEPIRVSTPEPSTTTKHTCGGPVFGKLTAGCPRCDELLNGAEPVRWSSNWERSHARRHAVEFERDITAHFAEGGAHSTGSCGPVCTFGDS